MLVSTSFLNADVYVSEWGIGDEVLLYELLGRGCELFGHDSSGAQTRGRGAKGKELMSLVHPQSESKAFCMHHTVCLSPHVCVILERMMNGEKKLYFIHDHRI